MAAGLLADALLAAGQAAEAVTWFRWVLDGRDRVLGPDHPGHHRGPGQPRPRAGGRRRSPARRSPSWSRRPGAASGSTDPATPGPWPPGTSTPPRSWPPGRPAEAIRCYQRSLAGRERLHGPDDPATLAAPLRLAGACLAAGKTKDAIAQYKRVLAGRERALGADHPDTLAARAPAWPPPTTPPGRWATRCSQHQEACAGYERVFGADHPDTLARRADLAHAYYAAGQLGDAVTLLRDSHHPQRAGPVPRRPADPRAAAGPGRHHRRR